MRAFDQNRDNLFTGWRSARIAQYARDRVSLYQQPHPVFNDGERELLREAWGFVVRKKGGRAKK